MLSEIVNKMRKTLNISDSIVELADFGTVTDKVYNMVKSIENLTIELSNECALITEDDSFDDSQITSGEYDTIQARIIEEQNMISITLPLALPSRNADAKKYSFSYYRNTYYKLLEPLLKNKSKFSEPVDIKIIQISPLDKLRDYDNLEPKMLLDVLASFLLKDDSPIYYDLSYSYEISDDVGTKIVIISKEKAH